MKNIITKRICFITCATTIIFLFKALLPILSLYLPTEEEGRWIR